MTYRDDLEAARQRRNALSHELRDVEKKMDELEALHERKRSLEKELTGCATDLDRARSRVALPMLSRLQVASPCHESWDSMTGDDRARFCGKCEKDVFDLSALTAEQAESLLRAHGASLCVRFYRRHDGTVLTSDCPVGQKQRKKRNKVAAALLAGGLAAAGIAAMTSATDAVRRPDGPPTVELRMGAVAPVPEPEPVVGQAVIEEEVTGPYMGDVAVEEVIIEAEPEVTPEPAPKHVLGRVAIDPKHE